MWCGCCFNRMALRIFSSYRLLVEVNVRAFIWRAFWTLPAFSANVLDVVLSRPQELDPRTVEGCEGAAGAGAWQLRRMDVPARGLQGRRPGRARSRRWSDLRRRPRLPGQRWAAWSEVKSARRLAAAGRCLSSAQPERRGRVCWMGPGFILSHYNFCWIANKHNVFRRYMQRC